MTQQEITEQFNNTGNIYYGHGIGASNQEVIDSIFKNGLRCSHKQLDFTTITLGEGAENLFRDVEETMNNWQHRDSKQIIVASIPKEWHLLDIMGTALYGKRHAALYNYISNEEATKLGIAPGYYLKPEFVIGVYDANNISFTQNEQYYENLSLEEQKRLFEEVKRQYIDLIKGTSWTLEEYAKIIREVSGVDIPLTPEEIAQADREIFEARDLEEQLGKNVQEAREGEFSQTTQGIRADAQTEEEIEYEGEWPSDYDWK